MSNLQYKIINRKKKLVFVPFFVAGFPDFKFLENFFIKNKDKIDILELGIPFSDPVADGPVLQEINYRAILNGVSLENTLNWLKDTEIPKVVDIVFLLYFNLLYDRLEEKLQKIKDIGVKGLVIPDLPLEESEALLPIFDKYGLDLVLFISPTTRKERREKIIKIAGSFLYFVSVKGVTGERDELPQEGINFAREVKMETDKPLIWGFGIRNKSQIENLYGLVDGVIVGSAFGRKLLEGRDLQSYFDELYEATL